MTVRYMWECNYCRKTELCPMAENNIRKKPTDWTMLILSKTDAILGHFCPDCTQLILKPPKGMTAEAVEPTTYQAKDLGTCKTTEDLT